MLVLKILMSMQYPLLTNLELLSIDLDIKSFLNSQQRIPKYTHAMYLAKSVYVAKKHFQFFLLLILYIYRKPFY